jgi:hypothetical protein
MSFPMLFPFVYMLFTSLVGGVVVILQFFTRFKIPTMICFKRDFTKNFLPFCHVALPYLVVVLEFVHFGFAKHTL